MAILSLLRPGTVLVHVDTGETVVLDHPEEDRLVGGWWTTDPMRETATDPLVGNPYLSVSALLADWHIPREIPDIPAADRDRITERFYEFHVKHPEVLTEIIRLTEQAANAGQTKTSMKRIFEVMRWSRHIQGEHEDEFKLNNVFTSRYARLIGEIRPDLADMFNTRKLAAERAA